jgi:hypothetical protein
VLEGGGELVLWGSDDLIDLTLPQHNYFEPSAVASFSYMVADDKGAESNAATVTLYELL